MARRKQREQTIFFPWERTGSLLSRLGLGRARQMSVLAGAVGIFVLAGYRERQKTGERSTRATLTVVSRAVSAYRADHEGQCPAELGQLVSDGYLQFEPRDAWQQPLRLLCPGFSNPRSFDLMSDGPDGEFGGLDRIE